MNQRKISKSHAATIEYVRQGLSTDEIGKKTNTSHYLVLDRLSRLCRRGYLERVDKCKYQVTDKPYIIREDEEKPPKPTEHAVPPWISNFLVNNYHLYKRSELAKQLGIPKVLLNNYLIEMGLGR